MAVPVEADGEVTDDAREPSLSVVIATREPFSSLSPLLDALVPMVLEVGGEVVVACCEAPPRDPVASPVVVVVGEDGNMLQLRRLAFEAARGPVIAVGEDHAVPRSDWCEAVLRAHRQHPDAPVVAGCLVNGTRDTVSGRANFLAFAAPFMPPMRSIDRPPPISVLSFKRDALRGAGSSPGAVESHLVPQLFGEGAMVLDDRIVVEHFQDHGVRWTLMNAFFNTRANYGYARSLPENERHSPRRARLRWMVTGMSVSQWREAWAARHEFERVADVVLVAAVCVATAAGAFFGELAGPGRAAERVA